MPVPDMFPHNTSLPIAVPPIRRPTSFNKTPLVPFTLRMPRDIFLSHTHTVPLAPDRELPLVHVVPLPVGKVLQAHTALLALEVRRRRDIMATCRRDGVREGRDGVRVGEVVEGSGEGADDGRVCEGVAVVRPFVVHAAVHELVLRVVAGDGILRGERVERVVAVVEVDVGVLAAVVGVCAEVAGAEADGRGVVVVAGVVVVVVVGVCVVNGAIVSSATEMCVADDAVRHDERRAWAAERKLRDGTEARGSWVQAERIRFFSKNICSLHLEAAAG